MNDPVKRLPKTIGGCLAELASVMRDAAVLAAKLAPLEKREKELREHLLTSFRKDELTSTGGSGLKLAVVTTRVPTLGEGGEGWDSFWAFAIKTARAKVDGKTVVTFPNSDLLPHNISTPAWRERVDQGVAVPGVVPFDRVGLRVTKDVKGAKK